MREEPLAQGEERVPVIGQGTWGYGDRRGSRTAEVEALRLGVSLGMTLIDTAEMYAAGGAERVVADAVADIRDKVFIVTKVWPSNAAAKDVEKAVSASLKRLRTDHVDGLLLHWPTRSVPIAETLSAMEGLKKAGAVRYYGVSNFDRDGLREALAAAPEGRVTFDQVPLSLGERRVERRLVPFAQERGVLVMAYSPLGHGRVRSWASVPAVRAVAERRDASPEEVALAWSIHRPGVIAIPKAIAPEHVRSNARAASVELTADDVRELESAFPVGKGDMPPGLPPYRAFHRLVFAAIRLSNRGTKTRQPDGRPG